MKNWNKTGKTKAIILGILFLPNLLMPIPPQDNISFIMIIMPLIFGIIAIPFLTKLNVALFGQIIEKPTWNDNPLTLKKPLRFFQFAAFFLITIGLSVIIGTVIKYQGLNQAGLSSMFFGIGILLGIQWLLKMTKK
jgi:hypothetical protein